MRSLFYTRHWCALCAHTVCVHLTYAQREHTRNIQKHRISYSCTTLRAQRATHSEHAQSSASTATDFAFARARLAASPVFDAPRSFRRWFFRSGWNNRRWFALAKTKYAGESRRLFARTRKQEVERKSEAKLLARLSTDCPTGCFSSWLQLNYPQTTGGADAVRLAISELFAFVSCASQSQLFPASDCLAVSVCAIRSPT